MLAHIALENAHSTPKWGWTGSGLDTLELLFPRDEETYQVYGETWLKISEGTWSVYLSRYRRWI